MSSTRNYKEVRLIESPGVKAYVYIPDLPSEERAKRMQLIHNEAANLLKGAKNRV